MMLSRFICSFHVFAPTAAYFQQRFLLFTNNSVVALKKVFINTVGFLPRNALNLGLKWSCEASRGLT